MFFYERPKFSTSTLPTKKVLKGEKPSILPKNFRISRRRRVANDHQRSKSDIGDFALFDPSKGSVMPNHQFREIRQKFNDEEEEDYDDENENDGTSNSKAKNDNLSKIMNSNGSNTMKQGSLSPPTMMDSLEDADFVEETTRKEELFQRKNPQFLDPRYSPLKPPPATRTRFPSEIPQNLRYQNNDFQDSPKPEETEEQNNEKKSKFETLKQNLSERILFIPQADLDNPDLIKNKEDMVKVLKHLKEEEEEKTRRNNTVITTLTFQVEDPLQSDSFAAKSQQSLLTKSFQRFSSMKITKFFNVFVPVCLEDEERSISVVKIRVPVYLNEFSLIFGKSCLLQQKIPINGEQLIRLSLFLAEKQLNDEEQSNVSQIHTKKPKIVSTNINKYDIALAESDGSPCTDFPLLNKGTNMNEFFKTQNLALILNKEQEEFSKKYKNIEKRIFSELIQIKSFFEQLKKKWTEIIDTENHIVVILGPQNQPHFLQNPKSPSNLSINTPADVFTVNLNQNMLVRDLQRLCLTKCGFNSNFECYKLWIVTCDPVFPSPNVEINFVNLPSQQTPQNQLQNPQNPLQNQTFNPTLLNNNEFDNNFLGFDDNFNEKILAEMKTCKLFFQSRIGTSITSTRSKMYFLCFVQMFFPEQIQQTQSSVSTPQPSNSPYLPTGLELPKFPKKGPFSFLSPVLTSNSTSNSSSTSTPSSAMTPTALSFQSPNYNNKDYNSAPNYSDNTTTSASNFDHGSFFGSSLDPLMTNYSEYLVHEVLDPKNKKKQEKMLGIDSKFIYEKKISGSTSFLFFAKLQKTNYLENKPTKKPIENLISFNVDAENPKLLKLIYDDTVQRIMFSTVVEAQEFAKKVEYLKWKNRRGPNASGV